MDLKQFLAHHSPGIKLLDVKVIPKASSNRIAIPDDGNPTLKNPIRIYVTAVPESGKANAAVIKLLAKQSGMSKSTFSIIQGQTSNNKRIEARLD